MERRKCIQCGKAFVLRDSEIEFFKSKGLDLPKRCSDCRQKNKSGNKKTSSKEYRRYYIRKKDGKKSAIGGGVFAVSLAVALLMLEFSVVASVIATMAGLLLCAVISTATRKVEIQEFDTSHYKYTFYDTDSMVKHYVKHGEDVGCGSMENYLQKANLTISNPSALRKQQKDDGDYVYFYEKNGDFAVVAKAGYIRTYYKATRKYFDKQ